MPDAPNTTKKSSPKRRNNNSRRKNNNRGEKATTNSDGNSQVASQANSSNKRKRFSQNKNRRPKSLTPARITQKYDNLMEQYITARRKYFELHGRSNTKQLGKIEKNYQLALKNLRAFESELKEDWQKEVLHNKIDGLPLDRQYTSDNNIEPVGDVVAFVGEFEDPHLLPIQKEHQWTEDTEESSGSIDDYNTYKGISS